MSFVTPLIKEVVINGLLLAKLRTQPETKAGLGLYIAAGLLGLLSLPFLGYGCYLGLQAYTDPAAAAALTGVILIAAAATIGVTGHFMTRARTRKAELHREQSTTSIVQTLMATFEDELGDSIKENPKTALAFAALAGLIAGRKL